jgi:hypothetical protein
MPLGGIVVEAEELVIAEVVVRVAVVVVVEKTLVAVEAPLLELVVVLVEFPSSIRQGCKAIYVSCN